MNRQIRQVAVLGSGVMGSAIAAHFANAGVRALVLDIVPGELDERERAAGLDLTDPRVRNRFANHHVTALLKSKPAALFDPSRARLIETGNFDDDMHRVAEADWVIEVVKEDMGIKTSLLKKVAPHLAPHALLTTNTSGLSIETMAQALPKGLRPRFFGTHFFNPPRYMRLLEIIPTQVSDPEAIAFASQFGSVRLGKGIVPAKDTPNFIANRIGVHSLMATFDVMQREGLTVEEIDALTGPAMGRPKTATFRLADLVGVDTLALVAETLRREAKDECEALFQVPAGMQGMVEKGLLGRKAGAGFYKKVRKPKPGILTLDLDSLEYREPIQPDLPELKALKKIESVSGRIAALIEGDSKANRAAWKILAATLSYSAMRVGEIADTLFPIDDAMCLGFNWELGPFQTWEELGFRKVTERLKKDGYALPAWVEALMDAGADSLFETHKGVRTAPTVDAGKRESESRDPRALSLATVKSAAGVVRKNDGASLLDLGDGVLGLEFHTKMNAIDRDIAELCHEAVEEAENNWQAIVVANDGEQFCAGANLAMVIEAIGAKKFDDIESLVKRFQDATMVMESAGVPVVCAPHGLALGGGAEVVLMGHAVQAHAESYIGLVEVGAGLVPAGGGCLRLYRRNLARLGEANDMYPALKQTFEAIGMGQVSTSAEHAQQLGFLGPQDRWTMNRDHLTSDAKELALAMASAGWQPESPAMIPVMGRGGIAVVESALVNMHEGRFISGHDRKIGGEIARILSGGEIAGPTEVSAQHILDLEREAFLRLCGETKTQERIMALLKTGKPLRN